MTAVRDLPTYAALIRVLPTDREFTFAEVSRKAVAAINALGPFECSPFEQCDVALMIHHLRADGVISLRIEDTYHDSGHLERRELFYTLRQPELTTIDMFGSTS